ncbi:lysozyme-like protein [Ralstonia phage RpY2]|uniref:Lysozyme-like protein n=1 Tax=Ralstonia phage RpY2 TaxID=2880950 RepID=A0AC61TNN9_9CAUD|nr:lysozyme-like protein [Ralstonia phage RpY2]WAX26374.1 lysin [Ralstonia phage p2137]
MLPTPYPGLPPMKKRATTDLIVIHCADTKPTMDWGARDIHRVHVVENHWAAIGYHIVIRRDGTVEGGRPLDAVGAHAAQVNSHSVGVCLIGGYGGKATDPFEKNFTKEQALSLLVILKELREKYPSAAIIGHQDVQGSGKTCPNFPAKAWAAEHIQ